MADASAGCKQRLHGLRTSLHGFKQDLSTSLSMWAEDFDVLGKVLVRLIDKEVASRDEAVQTVNRESRGKKLLQAQVNRITCVWEKEHHELVTLRQTVALQNKTMVQLRERIAKNDRRSNDDASPSEETPRKDKVVVAEENVEENHLTPPMVSVTARRPRRFSVGSSTLTRTTEAYAAKRKHIPQQPQRYISFDGTTFLIMTCSILKRQKYDDVTDENSTKQVSFQTEYPTPPSQMHRTADTTARFPLRERLTTTKPAPMRVRRSSLGSSMTAAARVLTTSSTGLPRKRWN
ncbi:hypothetical protein H257_07243 [Aphanomyces astaci]|uniref:Uncharacterized protein n=1 Tax=Aphanomyces astaci TaxID=112090 RepID=W4GHM8_APHAT|nr:hypothetical protein H257_07243 [Aphanomyces astaci]ETV79162.1 hypothetical protein H257_07243 [Aphanomyces astaci]|eukprot:XP_009831003.1 hypothetical protein H257_07243 [Aphanomyces astaci]